MLDGVRLTLTADTGTGVTVSTAVAVTPSTVAVIVALPGVTAVTTPDALTDATAGAPLLHVTARPVNTFPEASRALAVSACVVPTTRLADAGLTLTAATGTGVTVSAAVAVTPSTVAVIVALPGATAVTTPAADTAATDGVPLLHVTVRPVSALPAASRALAVSACVAPTTKLADAGLTLTAATGTGVTVIVAVAVTPSIIAVIIALPGAIPVTTPAAETVATAGVPLLHVTAPSGHSQRRPGRSRSALASSPPPGST